MLSVEKWPAGMALKECSRCRTPRTLDDFHKRRESTDGREHVCKHCKNEMRRIRRAGGTPPRMVSSPRVEARRAAVLARTDKRCPRCDETKPVEEFGKCVAKPDGRRAHCLACTRARDRKEREKNPEKMRERGRQQWRKHRIVRLKRDALRKFDPAERIKMKARRAVRSAMNAGQLQRPAACHGCGLGKPLEAHHPDYARPLHVEWLCVSCHRRHHREMERNMIPASTAPDPSRCPSCGFRRSCRCGGGR